MEISASGINLYLQCPYAFKIKYIDKVEVLFESPYLITGKLVHRALELYFTEKMKDKDTLTTPSDFLKIALEEYSHMNALQLEDCISEAKHYLDIYTPVAVTLEPVEAEQYFELKLDEDFTLRGYVDLIVKEGKKYHIIDFKTTRGQIKDNVKYTIQLSIYHLAHNVDAYYLHYITPTHVEVKQIEPIGKEELNEIIENVKASVYSNCFPPSGMVNNLCGNCNYRKHCKFAKIK
jgi:RecB family exonuclease